MITVTLWMLMLTMTILIKILAVFLGIPIYSQMASFMNSMTIGLMAIKFSIVLIGFVYETKRV